MRQKHKDWNCVIAKNGGSKCLSSYVDSLGPRLDDERVRMLVLPGRGLGYALNQALGPLLDEYDAWANLEDDDEWHEDFLKVMWENLPGHDVAHCLQEQVPVTKQSNGGKMNTASLKRRNWINWPMCLFRSRVYREVGPISEDSGSATDWDWHLRCTSAGFKYKFVNTALVTHHWHGKNYCLSEKTNTNVLERIREGVYK